MEAVRLASLPEAVINLRNGRSVRGEILDEDDVRFILNVKGLRTEVLRSDVRTVRRLPPALERYLAMRETVAADDVESRLALADWLRERELYAEALTEVEMALEASPGHPAATRMRVWLDAQLSMRRATPRDDTPRGETEDRLPRRPRPSMRAEVPMLGETDINRIRVYEVDLSDPPRMRVPAETIRRLLSEYADHPAVPSDAASRQSLFERPAHEVLDLMFRVKARDLYPEVQITEDPEALRVFRRELHGRTGWLINACASVRCHGGNDAGWFKLATERAYSDATVYTNFYILDQARLADGTPLIQHDEPESSPLLQFATARPNSTRPHPETPAKHGPGAWKPVFRDTGDAKFRDTVEWIRMLYRPRPEYGIAYDVPSAPTQPEPPPESQPTSRPQDPAAGQDSQPTESSAEPVADPSAAQADDPAGADESPGRPD